MEDDVAERSRIRRAEIELSSAEQALEMSKELYRDAMTEQVDRSKREDLLQEAKRYADIAQELSRKAANKVRYK